MVFTDHQQRQFYVIDNNDANKSLITLGNKGYFKFNDADGSIITTDKFDKGSIRSIRVSKQPGFNPKVWNIYPSKTSVTDTYVLHMLFRNAFGGGVNDFFIKDPAFIAAPGDSIANLVNKLYKAVKDAFRNVGDVTNANDSNVPFHISKGGASPNFTHLIIAETVPTYNKTNTIRGMFQLHLDLDIHCGDKIELRDSSGNLTEAGNPWGFVNAYNGSTAITELKDYTAEQVAANKYFYHSGVLYQNGSTASTAGSLPTSYTEITSFKEASKGDSYYTISDVDSARENATDYQTGVAYNSGAYIKYNGNFYKVTANIVAGSNTAFSDLTATLVAPITAVINGPMVAEMEYFFSKGRGDLFGYMGFPDVNPTEQRANAANDYWMLDIKYSYNEGGVNSNLSEKELTIACPTKSVLTTFAAALGTAVNSATYPAGSINATIYTPTF